MVPSQRWEEVTLGRTLEGEMGVARLGNKLPDTEHNICKGLAYREQHTGNCKDFGGGG